MSQINLIADAVQKAASAQPQLKKLKKACQDMEAVFLKNLLATMRRSLPKSPFGDAPGAEIYEDMFDQAIAESGAKNGSFGIGKMLYKTMAPSVMREAGSRRPNDSKTETLDLRG